MRWTECLYDIGETFFQYMLSQSVFRFVRLFNRFATFLAGEYLVVSMNASLVQPCVQRRRAK